MGLIYVNPEGPNGKPDPIAAARDIRETFFRMAMNDEETVALIAGGHTFGKTHGAGDPSLIGPAPEGCEIEFRVSAGRARMAAVSAPTPSPAARKSPGRRRRPSGAITSSTICSNLNGNWRRARPAPFSGRRKTRQPPFPDAYDTARKHVPTMLTTDLSLRFDPAYEKISRRFYEHPEEFADAFARAWFKLTHRDMGPIVRYLGPLVPKETLIWQDPIPAVDHPLIGEEDIAALKAKILAVRPVGVRSWCRRRGPRPRRSAAPTSAAARTARASASRRRRTGRSTSRPSSRPCLAKLEAIQKEFNASASGGKKVSLADLIVLAGGAAASRRRRRMPASR